MTKYKIDTWRDKFIIVTSDENGQTLYYAGTRNGAPQFCCYCAGIRKMTRATAERTIKEVNRNLSYFVDEKSFSKSRLHDINKAQHQKREA